MIRREIVNTSGAARLWRFSTKMNFLHICVERPPLRDFRNEEAYRLKMILFRATLKITHVCSEAL